MEERKGDPRMYIISGFLFLCVVSGGILLGLYIFLPEKFFSSYYAAAGLILVGVPWIFWSLAYIYKCFSPSNNHKGNNVNHVKRVNIATPVTSPKQAASTPRAKPMSPVKESSSGEDSNCGRHVHFGEIIVLGNEENVNDVENDETANRERHWRMISESIEESDSNLASNDNKDSADQRGIEMPLPLL